MRKLLLLVVSLLAAEAHAQPNVDCTSADLRVRFTQGASFTVPCDTMFLLSDVALQAFFVERDKLRSEADLADREIAQLRGVIDTQDSLLAIHREDVETLENHLTFTQTRLDTLQMRLEESIELTDEVIAIARRKNTLAYVFGGLGGAAVGIFLGVLAE